MNTTIKLDQSSAKITLEKVQLFIRFCGKPDSWTLVLLRSNDIEMLQYF